ncbi:unnamed protein product [Cylicocyclus nassatus]|uniref:Hexosyltransferase n=1 Tax=Cylicocyclus nassatus TaxID=53992 RepID=A0AA36M602_CYLNA|nr:unnamed protein product [Cylicocyclus nassatus]
MCLKVKFRLNLTRPTVHEGSKAIVLVNSALNEIGMRDTIRYTWANPAFSKLVKNRMVSVVFLVGTDNANDLVRKELATGDDILQVDVSESYANLVYKVLAAYLWIHDNYPEKFVLKIDSDTVILMDKIEPLLVNSTTKSMQCYAIIKSKPLRCVTDRWYVPQSVYPAQYFPAYCNGPAYLLSPAALNAILQAAPKEQVFEIEDAFFTGVLGGKVGVKIVGHRGIWLGEKNSQPCVDNRGTVIAYPVHNANAKRIARAWSHIQNLRCRWIFEHFLLTYFHGD